MGGPGTVGFSFAAFIPQKTVAGPLSDFEGDNRGFSSNLPNYRIQQNFILDLKSQTIQILNPQTGTTRAVSGLQADQIGHAPTNGIKAIVTKNKTSFHIRLQGRASNPLLAGSPNIGYNIDAYVGFDGRVLGIYGDHTQFPGFELWSYRNGVASHHLGYNPVKYGTSPFPDLYNWKPIDQTDYIWSGAIKKVPKK